MSDPSLIADLVRAGVDAELIGRVSNAMLNVRDNVRDIAVREYENTRKRNYRKTIAAQANAGGAQANDGATSGAENIPQNVPDTVQNHCDLTSLLPSLKGTSEKGSKGTENARARGTRLLLGSPLSDVDRAAAIELGAMPDQVAGMWAEFVDYWCAVPGQRGLKTNWRATWRNRVRNIISRGTRNVQTGQNQPGGAYGASKDRFREAFAELKAYNARQRDGGDGEIVEFLPAIGRGGT